MKARSARAEALASAVLPVLLYGVGGAAIVLAGRTWLHGIHAHLLMALTVFALWRYGWQWLHFLRAGWYAAWHYPHLRRLADEAAVRRPWPKRVFVVVASYLEEPWVTVEAMQALMANIAQLPCATTVIVATGSDRDEALITSAWNAHPARRRAELVLQRQSQGKRVALGHALRAVARRDRDEPDSVTILMDGDTRLEAGALARSIPFFLAFRDLGAATTNEVAFIPGRGAWYRDWFELKFGQRHVLFQSHALSHKVLTLTGRFSLFRTSIVVAEDFIATLENDTLDHWLHGRFRFLMGDDKTTWFQVLRAGWDMLYLPDVTCCSLESREASFLKSSLSLPYRWFGNTLRNTPRALALGPRRTGWMTWFVLLDQRLSMWSSLVGIAGALLLTVTKSLLYLPLYVAWAGMVRSVQLVMIALHGHRVSWRTIPIMLYTQWLGAVVKIRAWHHLADQSWSKGKAGGQGVAAAVHPMRRLAPLGTMVLSYAGFALVILLAHSTLRLPGAELFAAEATAGSAIDAGTRGVKPDDGLDDGAALQALIDQAPPGQPLVVQLPPGQLDLRSPVVIRRGDVTLQGAGQERTRIVSHLHAPVLAALLVQGNAGHRIGSLASPMAEDALEFRISTDSRIAPGMLVLLRQPNDDALLQQLGAQKWKREYPYLRQALLKVVAVQDGRVRVEAAPGIAFDAVRTQVAVVQPLERVHLADFSIEQRADGRNIAAVAHRYDNVVPDVQLDAIAFDWTLGAGVERVSVRNAGRHPVSFENSYGFALRDCLVDGAWNKGDGGSGYVRIARSYHGTVERCQVRNIRHIALQWSSAFNTLRDLDSEVDVNFHGGFSHHNTVDHVRFAIPAAHHWGPVFVTPPDAGWAPPDGPGNRVTASNTAPTDRAASPTR